MRSARILSCVVDSSPEAYRMVRDLMERRFWSTRVDLPTPGSPPMSTMAPGTRPPPSTRLSSADGSLMRGRSETAIWLSGVATERVPSEATGDGERDGLAATFSSMRVFHSPHEGHLPSQRDVVAPHDVQAQMDLYLALAMSEESGAEL